VAVVHELLMYGADPNAEKKNQLSILQTARIRADDDVVKLLIRYGAV
jgi:ankyrin repeat protein